MAGTYARTTETLVIGGGPGGYIAAIRLGQLGKKALLVERRELERRLLLFLELAAGLLRHAHSPRERRAPRYSSSAW